MGETERRHHMQTLVLCAAVVVVAALLNVGSGGITLPGLAGRPLPGMCVTRAVFHMDCPGCGMTRSFVAIANGQFRLGFGQHRLGPFLFLLMLVQVPLRAYALLTGRMPRWLRHRAIGPWLMGGLTIALVVNWLYNLVTGAVFH